jgi:hypothetical protein
VAAGWKKTAAPSAMPTWITPIHAGVKAPDLGFVMEGVVHLVQSVPK